RRGKGSSEMAMSRYLGRFCCRCRMGLTPQACFFTDQVRKGDRRPAFLPSISPTEAWPRSFPTSEALENQRATGTVLTLAIWLMTQSRAYASCNNERKLTLRRLAFMAIAKAG